jgi:hypothetical protein
MTRSTVTSSTPGHCFCISSTKSLVTSALNSFFLSADNRRALFVGGGRYRGSLSVSKRTSCSSVRNHLSLCFLNAMTSIRHRSHSDHHNTSPYTTQHPAGKWLTVHDKARALGTPWGNIRAIISGVHAMGVHPVGISYELASHRYASHEHPSHRYVSHRRVSPAPTSAYHRVGWHVVMCYGGPDGFDQTLVGQRLLRLDDEPRADSGTRVPFLLRARELATKARTDGLIGDQPIPVNSLSFDGRRGVAEISATWGNRGTKCQVATWRQNEKCDTAILLKKSYCGGRISHGYASHGRVPHERASYRRMSHRRVPHERASHLYAPHRRVLHGRAPHRRVPYGRAPHRRVPYGRCISWACTS